MANLFWHGFIRFCSSSVKVISVFRISFNYACRAMFYTIIVHRFMFSVLSWYVLSTAVFHLSVLVFASSEMTILLAYFNIS